MNIIKKVVNPGKCERGQAFCEINIIDGKLSIHGVIGPKNNGDCTGASGQCQDEIKESMVSLSDDWTPEMFEKFIDTWNEWHLNDLHPECEHQKQLGWIEEGKKKLYKHCFVIDNETSKKQTELEKSIKEKLIEGLSVKLNEEDRKLLSYPFSKPIYTETPDKFDLEHYKYSTLTAVNSTSRCWVRYEEDERGLIGKPCPVCGYKYGTSWKTVELPEEVVNFIFSLPSTSITPAWV